LVENYVGHQKINDWRERRVQKPKEYLTTCLQNNKEFLLKKNRPEVCNALMDMRAEDPVVARAVNWESVRKLCGRANGPDGMRVVLNCCKEVLADERVQRAKAAWATFVNEGEKQSNWDALVHAVQEVVTEVLRRP
jgi:hypothetical protein